MVKSTRQKGRAYELKVLREVYTPIDESAVTVGGSARSDYKSDIQTNVYLCGLKLIPECKNNKSNAFLSDFRQACEQAKSAGGMPVLHKHIHGTSESVVILRQKDFAALLKEIQTLASMI